ncbi:MAG: DNA-binding transcriptional regulator YhcF (GntR family) [Myxococcota bacterium]
MVSWCSARSTGLAELKSDGLIVRLQGRGTFVADGVAPAAEHAAHARARQTLAAAVSEALSLGLPPSDIRAVIDQHLARPTSEDS